MSRLTGTLLGIAISALIWTPAGVGQAVPSPWQRPTLVEPGTVTMGGIWGRAFESGLARIGQDPYTVNLILADVNFNMERWFTNFSGDVSGRFLELASLTSRSDSPQPATLAAVMDQIVQYQQADGHFGAAVDWSQPIDLGKDSSNARMMPILWGNGRLLLGLVAASERFHNDKLLAAARKLGDFYATIVVQRFCDPTRMDEYRQKAWYAGNYVTCTFEGMEGLVQLYRATRDKRYLDTVQRMADFHEPFDTLPVDHSHGSISAHEALLLLYEETGEAKYLKRVCDRWEAAVQGGFINACGGVLEKYWITGCDRDEGCSEADWLRLNLMLWRLTGQTRYLDMAERLLWNEYPANQWPSGGFGHRQLGCDDQGPFAYYTHHQEALWCCSFHGPLALYYLKSYLAVGSTDGIWFNFPVDFTATVPVGQNNWTITSRALPEKAGVPLRCAVTLTSDSAKPVPLRIRIPDWAERVEVTTATGQKVTCKQEGTVLVTQPLSGGTELEIAYPAAIRLENRRLIRMPIPTARPASLDQAVACYGPFVLMNHGSGDIQPLTLQTTANGTLRIPDENGKVLPKPWYQLANPQDHHAFVFNATIE